MFHVGSSDLDEGHVTDIPEQATPITVSGVEHPSQTPREGTSDTIDIEPPYS